MLGGRELSSIPTSQDIFAERNLIHKIHLNNGINFANNPKNISHTSKDNEIQFPSAHKDFNTYRDSSFDSPFKQSKRQQLLDVPKGSLTQRRLEVRKEPNDQGSSKFCIPRSTVRIFSPKEDRYVYSTVDEENRSLKQAYLSLRSLQNAGSSHVGKAANKEHDKKLDYLINPSKNRKFYSANVETSQLSWAERHILSPTSNYESAKFNIINHSPGQNASLAKMLKENQFIGHRIKGVTEYCDLARVTAIKPNKEYNNTLKEHPKCFYRTNNLCTNECNIGRSYAHLLKSYH